jgi:hemolysin III
MEVKIKDPMSALTHFIGAILSLVAVTSLVMKAYYMDNPLYMVAFGIFGASLVLLYSASTIYHIVARPQRISKLLKRVDHMMIFVLIAGTYTPICLIPLHATSGGKVGITILTLVWCVAILGIFLKIVWLNAPRWLSTAQYILMGWIAAFAIVPLFQSMSISGFIWLLVGGVLYTIGGLIYATKWPKFNFKGFGFHEVFHVFVLVGSLCHYLMILTLV